MLPSTAIPSAPPSSAPVSEIPDATPARSGGDAADDEIGSQRDRRRDAEGDDDGADHDQRDAESGFDLREQPEAGRGEREAAGDDVGGPKRANEDAGRASTRR